MEEVGFAYIFNFVTANEKANIGVGYKAFMFRGIYFLYVLPCCVSGTYALSELRNLKFKWRLCVDRKMHIVECIVPTVKFEHTASGIAI